MNTNNEQDKYPKPSINTIDHNFLNLASLYAKQNAGCLKVRVGSVILNEQDRVIAMGCNKSDYNNFCTSTKTCLREELYGNRSKAHRAPSDCRAIHSEIDAICSAGRDLRGCTIYITRYPCENCARAIVAAGIKNVIYGRSEPISDMTRKIFDFNGVEYTHIFDYVEDDDNS